MDRTSGTHTVIWGSVQTLLSFVSHFWVLRPWLRSSSSLCRNVCSASWQSRCVVGQRWLVASLLSLHDGSWCMITMVFIWSHISYAIFHCLKRWLMCKSPCIPKCLSPVSPNCREPSLLISGAQVAQAGAWQFGSNLLRLVLDQTSQPAWRWGLFFPRRWRMCPVLVPGVSLGLRLALVCAEERKPHPTFFSSSAHKSCVFSALPTPF